MCLLRPHPLLEVRCQSGLKLANSLLFNLPSWLYSQVVLQKPQVKGRSASSREAKLLILLWAVLLWVECWLLAQPWTIVSKQYQVHCQSRKVGIRKKQVSGCITIKPNVPDIWRGVKQILFALYLGKERLISCEMFFCTWMLVWKTFHTE